MFKSTNIK